MKRAARIAVLTCVIGSCASSSTEAPWTIDNPPVVSGETDDVTVTNGTLADGTYWAEIARISGTGDIAFRVTKARFGDTCEAWARDNGLEFCANDYAVESYPDAYVALNDDAAVSVAKPDGPGTNYMISVNTLKRLLRGDTVGAPDGYTWAAFPFLVDVGDGYAIAARQFWVP
jgi:hypothetical protein